MSAIPGSGGSPSSSPPPPSDPALNAALGMDDATALQARMAKSRERQEKFAEQTDRDTASIETAQGKLRDLKPPTPQALPTPPEIKNRPPEEAFGSLAMIMAMTGSLLTRRPFVNALNAGAEVMKAFQAGDDAAAKAAIDTWHTNVENAKALHSFQQDTYEADLKGIDTDLKGSIAMLQAHARAFQDEATAQLADTGMIRELHDHIDRQRKNSDAFSTATDKLKLDKWKAEHAPGTTPTITPETAKRLAKMVVAGNHAAITELGYGQAGTANRTLVENTITELANDPANKITPEQLNAAMAMLKGRITEAQTTGRRAGQLNIAASAAMDMADLVHEKSLSVPRTSFMPINRILATAREELGDPNIVALQGSINTFINAYARAISPTGVATVSDKDHARAILSVAQSQDQLDAQLEVLRQELQIEHKAVGKSFDALQNEIGDGARSSKPTPMTLPKEPKDLLPGEYYTIPGHGAGYWNPKTQSFDDEPPQ